MNEVPATTLAIVAQEARVSRMTVSRVLRGAAYVAPATRDRVLDTVRKLGYRPNPMVSALMTYVRGGTAKTDAGVLAYLTSGAQEHSWRQHAIYLDFYEGAIERAENLGYKLEEFWLRQRGVSMARLSRILYARGIAGVIVAPLFSSHGHLNLDWNRFSAVAIGYSLLKPSLSRVSNDQYDSILIALRELRRRGYTRIGFAMPQRNDRRVHYHWSAGYLSFHQRLRNASHPPLFLPDAWEKESAIAWVRRHRPEAVISMCPEFLDWLESAGYHLPRDIGYVNLDWSKQVRPCAGIDQRPREVGAAAVDVVVGQLNRNKLGIPSIQRNMLVPGQWVPGPTIRERRPSTVK
jgi:DNA-binding LacI/PurR family transcriptional regulator